MGGKTMGVTTELSKWIVEASYGDFPEEAIASAKSLLLKTVVGMVAGSREPAGRRAIRYLSRVGGSPQAGVVGAGFRTSVENAAWAHGIFAHASELEDEPWPHVIGNYWIYPAIFPLAEDLVCSGRDVIEAAVVSFEVGGRLVRAAEWAMGHNIAVYFSVMGAAAVGAKMLRLTAEETENALSIAASHSSGLQIQEGSEAHFIESGHSCRAGVLSAYLAREGATGKPGILENHGGLYAPMWRPKKPDLDSIMDGLGKPPFVVSNAGIKKYPFCLAMHTTVDTLTDLIKENKLRPEEVERVDVEVAPWAAHLCDRPFPDNLGDARFSFTYVVSELLHRGVVDESSFAAKERLTQLEETQGKVKVTVPADFQKTDPNARVTVLRKDGQKLVKERDAMIGSVKYPLTLEQVRDMSRPYLDAVLEKHQRDLVEESMLTLEKQLDILDLMDMLTFSRSPSRARG